MMHDVTPIWVRSIKYHSYHNILREPDTFYAVDSPEDLETILAQRVAVHELPPPRAQRPVVIATQEAHIAAHPDAPSDLAAATQPTGTLQAKVMTTEDVPKAPRTLRRKP